MDNEILLNLINKKQIRKNVKTNIWEDLIRNWWVELSFLVLND